MGYRDPIAGRGDEIAHHARRLGMPATLSKQRTAPYRAGASREWIITVIAGGKRHPAEAAGSTTRTDSRRRPKPASVATTVTEPGSAEVAGVRLSHPDRVLPPGHSLTKLALVRLRVHRAVDLAPPSGSPPDASSMSRRAPQILLSSKASQ